MQHNSFGQRKNAYKVTINSCYKTKVKTGNLHRAYAFNPVSQNPKMKTNNVAAFSFKDYFNIFNRLILNVIQSKHPTSITFHSSFNLIPYTLVISSKSNKLPFTRFSSSPKTFKTCYYLHYTHTSKAAIYMITLRASRICDDLPIPIVSNVFLFSVSQLPPPCNHFHDMT